VTDTCTMTLVLEYDSVDCYLPAGHAGPHKCVGDGVRFFWAYDR
jgi:hypothetical protein